MSLVDMALAFVLRHRAVTSAIVGPRTMEQLVSQLGAPDVVLSDHLLDAIAEIVPPGTNLSTPDAGWVPPVPRGRDPAPPTGVSGCPRRRRVLGAEG
jgi:hypothetical protein